MMYWLELLLYLALSSFAIANEAEGAMSKRRYNTSDICKMNSGACLAELIS